MFKSRLLLRKFGSYLSDNFNLNNSISIMSVKTFKKVSVVKLSANFAEATKIVEVEKRNPKENEVLIKNIYAGVNASDINMTAGRYGTDGKVPFDIGVEALGVVEAVGNKVTTIKVGQPALAFTNQPKAYAEYLYLKPEEVIPVPEVRPEFISFLVCGLTATLGLDQSGLIKRGDKVLITAAAGGTGHIGVQWAKQKGCFVIGTTSSKDKEKLLKELGCDRVINYREESIDDVLTREFANGIDLIWETIGGEVYKTLFKHIAVKGRLVIVGGISSYKTVGLSDVVIPNLSTHLLMGSKSLTGFFLPNHNDSFKEYFKKLMELYLNKKLKIVIDLGQNNPNGKFEGIDAVVKGVEYLQSGRNTGKVVVKIQDN